MKTLSISPKNDFAFCFVFGREENQELLISFLNAILLETDNQPITDLQIMNSEMLPEMAEQKLARLDVRVTTSDGRHINIEIQLVNHHNMERRTLYYWSLLAGSQLSAEDYSKLNKTITINILDFSYLRTQKYHSIYHLREETTNHRLTDVMEIHFIELPKFRESDENMLDSPLSRWLAFLDGDSTTREVLRMNDPLIDKACCELQKIQMDPAARRLYEARELGRQDYVVGLQGAREEGKTEGIEEGREEGREEALHEVAVKMIQCGVDDSTIMEITGLSSMELAKLRTDTQAGT